MLFNTGLTHLSSKPPIKGYASQSPIGMFLNKNIRLVIRSSEPSVTAKNRHCQFIYDWSIIDKCGLWNKVAVPIEL